MLIVHWIIKIALTSKTFIMIRKLTSFLYNSSSVRKKFNNKFFVVPSKVIFTNSDVDNIKSLNWLFSKRLNLVINENKIILGNKHFLIEDVKNVVCYKLKSNLLFITYSAYKIELKDKQFIYLGVDKFYNRLNELLNVKNTKFLTEKKSFLNPSFLFVLCLIMLLILSIIS